MFGECKKRDDRVHSQEQVDKSSADPHPTQQVLQGKRKTSKTHMQPNRCSKKRK